MNRKGLWNGLFIAAAIGAGIALSMKPWQVYEVQRDKASSAVQEMREAEHNRAELTRQKARYESSLGREELARKMGYTMPGEQPAQKDDVAPVLD